MIRSSLPFLVGALVEGPLGFGGTSGTSAGIVRVVLIGLVLFLAVSFLVGLARRS